MLMEEHFIANERIRQDSTILLDIFPEEVWVLILDKVKSNGDIENCYHASNYFQRLLEPSRTLLFFPQLFEILEKSKRLEREEALKLREVCKPWKNVIDNYHQKRLLALKNIKDCGYAEYFTEFFFASNKYSITEMDIEWSIPTFLAHFKETHPPRSTSGQVGGNSPFVAKTVKFYFGSEDGDIADLDSSDVTLVLSKYGFHIHICTFEFDSQFAVSACYNTLMSWLGLMENLKRLLIKFNETLPMPVDELAVQNRQHATCGTFPKLEKLEQVKFVNFLPLFVNQFIQVNNHVKEIDIDCKCPELYDIFSLPLLNLTHLKTDMNIRKLIEIETAQFSSKFTNLELTFSRREEPNVESMFAAMENNWRDSLTYFTLTFLVEENGPWNEDAVTNLREDCVVLQQRYLPHVTKFEIWLKHLANECCG